ncbi:MAG: ABC transporter substrate-binding protein [candidate division Zixibacteria bacterium]|nr:ABC transporter substrate-binding protein [candidate division Zixibacteria bacterium]
MIDQTRYILIWLIATVLGLSGIVESARAETPIAVLMSDSLTSTKRTLHGARKMIVRTHPDAILHTFYLTQAADDNKLVIDSLRSLSPKLVLTIGSPATSLAKQKIEDIPIVFAGVLYPVLSGFVESVGRPGGNITGASLDIPVQIQFKYFKQIVPELRKVGVLYTEATASLIRPATVVAQNMGLTLTPVLISNDKEIPSALDSLAGIVEGIWSVADPELFDPKSTRYILLNTLRKGIPFMGFSQYVVESGALFALDFDHKAVGHQAGEIASRVLAGEAAGKIKVSIVDVIWFHYNERTAHHINIEIPEDLVAIAKEVYR